MRSLTRTVLLASDFSDLSRRTYDPVAQLAKEIGADVTLLHVVPDPRAPIPGAPLVPPLSAPELAVEVKRARELLAEHAGQITGAPVKCVVEAGVSVAETIARVARETGAVLIALSTHGRTGISRSVLGSVAEAVLRHATTPVLCFPQSITAEPL